MNQNINFEDTPVIAYPRWQRLMEMSSIWLFAIFSVLLCVAILGALFSDRSASLSAVWRFALISTPLLGYIAAEFGAGLVHCLADNFGANDTPIFGKAFIKPFRDHHADPAGITRHDFIEANGNNCLITLLMIIPTFALISWYPTPAVIFGAAFVLFLALCTVMTNQIHKWAHLAKPPYAIELLQRFGLILSPESHAIHHTSPHDRNYCITSGWLNPIIEKFGVFSTIVRILKRGA